MVSPAKHRAVVWHLAAAVSIVTCLYCFYHESLRLPWTAKESGILTSRDGYMGAIDSSGRIVIDFEWSSCTPFDPNELAIVSRSPMGTNGVEATRKWGVIDRHGHPILPIRFQRIRRADDAYFAWQPSGLVEYNKEGEVIANVDFEPLWSIMPDAEGLIAGRRTNEAGWFDRNGQFKIKLPAGLTPVSGFDNSGLAVVRNAEGLKGAVDPSGQLVIQPEWETIFGGAAQSGNRSAPLFHVERRGKHGLLNSHGETVVACEFDGLHLYTMKGIIIAEKPQGRFGALNLQGEVVIPSDWDLMHAFDSEGMCYAEKGDRRCWLNLMGDVVLELPPELATTNPQFDSAGFLSAFRAERHGCIDRTGKVVIDFIYDRSFSFDERDAAIVSKDGLYGLIDRQGSSIIPCQYDDLVSLLPWSEWLMFETNGKYGFIDRSGALPIKTQFENRPDIDEGTIFIETDKGFGILEIDGRECNAWSRHSLSTLQVETSYADSTFDTLVHMVKTLQGKHASLPTSEIFYSTDDDDLRLHGLYQRGVGVVSEPQYKSIQLTDFGIRATGNRVGLLMSFAEWLQENSPGLHDSLQMWFPWHFRFLAEEQSIEVLYDKEGIEFFRSDRHFRDHMQGLAFLAIAAACLWRARRLKRLARAHAQSAS